MILYRRLLPDWQLTRNWVFSLLLIVSIAKAQPVHLQSQLSPQIIDVEKGLPQAFVSAVVTDQEGFVWAGTLGGLARYDGQRMLVFAHQARDSSSIANNLITTITQGDDHSLWLLFESGELDCFDTHSGRSQHFPQLARALANLPYEPYIRVDKQQGIWGIIKGQGAFRYDTRKNVLTRFRRQTNQLRSDSLVGLAITNQGNVWLATQRGLSGYNPRTGHITQHTFTLQLNTPPAGLPWGSNLTEVLIGDGDDVIFTDKNRLLFFSPATNQFRSVQLPPSQPRLRTWLATGPKGGIYLILDDTLYRYTSGEGVLPVWHYKPAANEPLLLAGLACTGLSVDKSEVAWLGGNTKGLFRLDLTTTPLQPFTYQTTFCYDAIQTALGLNLSACFNWPFKSIAPSSYSFRMTSDQHRLWMALDREAGYYDTRTRSFSKTIVPLDKSTGATQGTIRGISLAPDGVAWLVRADGTPLYYEPATRRWRSLPINPWNKSLEANYLLADDHDLWVTTVKDGLLRISRSDRTSKLIRFAGSGDNQPNKRLLTLAADPGDPDVLWIGSHQGLIRFNKRTRRYRLFGTDQGLPEATVYTILADQQGYLWLSTNRGLCRFDPVHYNILTLTRSDGLPGQEFNRFHALKFPDGRLAFGGIKGWVLFNPARIVLDQTTPTVALTGLSINNQVVNQYGRYSPLDRPLNYLPDLQLTYQQNYLSVDFAALHYHQPDRATYRYQLKGYDATWIVTRRPAAVYTKLPPGHYVLRVNAANAAGRWSPYVKQLPVLIRPPVWATGWAYGLYGLLAGLLGWSIVRWRVRRERQRQEMILHERQAEDLRQLDAAKTRFFANVSHELRTPITLLVGPLSSVLARQQLDARDEKLIRLASNSAQQLGELVDELLNLTGAEAGQLIVQPQPVLLDDWFQTCMAPFELRARQLAIELTCESVGMANHWVQMDGGKVRQILHNLLTNACKFTSSGGHIMVVIIGGGDQLQFTVRDTGRGIHPADLPHVFERYFQTSQPNTPLEGGTGIGLALSRELVRLMQGTITVDSILGQGSVFSVTLPLTEVPGLTAAIQTTQVAAGDDFPPDSADAPDQTKGVDTSFALPMMAGASLLVVEDNIDLRTYLTAVFAPTFHVIAVANGQAALEQLGAMNQLPVLIIVDIMMPVMDGFQFLEAIKTHPAYRIIPVVMLTARAHSADKLRALRLGVDDYLLKPFKTVELTARVEALLRNQFERRQAYAVVEDSSIAPVYAGSELQKPVDAVSVPPLSASDLAWLERLEVLVNARAGDPDVTADELADELAMSRRTYYRTLNRLTGLTPAQYLSEVRFSQARQLLENRQVTSVKQVAYQVGFRKVSYFSQLYEQRFGKKPSDYL